MKIKQVLTNELMKIGKKISDITSIYHGRDHQCRCGCSGTYYSPDDSEFITILGKIEKCSVLEKGVPIRFSRSSDRYGSHQNSKGIEYHEDIGCLNIPLARTSDMCYCIYFK